MKTYEDILENLYKELIVFAENSFDSFPKETAEEVTNEFLFDHNQRIIELKSLLNGSKVKKNKMAFEHARKESLEKLAKRRASKMEDVLNHFARSVEALKDARIINLSPENEPRSVSEILHGFEYSYSNDTRKENMPSHKALTSFRVRG